MKQSQVGMILVLAILAPAFAAVVLSGCEPERKETPTKGKMVLLADESFAPVIKQERQDFEDLYKDARIELRVTTAREAVVQFFNVDSIRTIVLSRPLNQEEREVAKRFHMDFSEYKIAIDGIAVVVNKENPVVQLRTTQLDSVLRGMTTTWRQLGWRSSPDRVAACLPDQNAGEFEVVATKIIHGQKFGPANRAGSSPEMLSFVVNHPAALGFVSIGWLGDYKDKVKVLELSDPAAPDSLGIQGQYFTPHQAHIYRGYYPLTSDVYIYSRADMYSVAAGFITFVTSAPGQKIVLNDGLVPATMPVRLVEITDKALQQ